MAFKQEVNVPLIVTIGIVSGIMLLVTVIGVQAWYQDEEQAEAAAKAQEYQNTWLDNLKTDQQANIGTYRWVDKKTGTVAIPVSDAMKIMADTRMHPPTTQPSDETTNR